MTEIKAQLQFLRMSPRKVRLAADLIRGLPVSRAETQLRFLTKAASEPLSKLLLSAVANAKHSFGLSKEDLFVKAIIVDGGPSLKRSTPRAFGRATPIKKRSSHILLTLGSTKDAQKIQAQALAKPEVVKEAEAPVKGALQKPQAKTPEERMTQKPKKQGFFRRFFSRKAI